MIRSNFQSMFLQLSDALFRYRQFWQFQPMQQAALPQPDDFLPIVLRQQLHQLDLEQCLMVDSDNQRLGQLFGEFFPELPVFELASSKQQPAPAPFWLSTGVSGRKWQQISAFVATVGQHQRPVLEWCAGKGHLGRLFAQQTQQPVTSLEWQASLCQQGQALADALKLPQHFHQVDVLTEPTSQYFQANQQWVALHACGDLHRVGIAGAIAAKTEQLALVPCCYHLQAHSHYNYRSILGQQSVLTLSKSDLRLAVQGHATGGARIVRLSQQEMTWRHAFWAYAQSLGLIDYQPLTGIPKQLFNQDIHAFFEFACMKHQLPIPSSQQLSSALALAEQRLLTQRRLELVQHVFRRPLELYLVLDLAIWLEEQQYEVTLETLCAESLTPRNLLLQAIRR